MKELLEIVWKQIEDDYQDGLIHAERCMQASFYRALRDLDVPSDGLRSIFVEPYMSVEGTTYPDIVVCEGDEIRAIIELKCVPHWYSEFKDDLQKLAKFERSGTEGFHLEIEPCTGKYTDRQFKITNETLYVFAVITRHDAEAVSTDLFDKYEGPSRFVHLIGKIPGEKNAGSKQILII
mgnify:CR=1 FL=1